MIAGLPFRPQLTDYRLAAQRVKKLERLLALHNIRWAVLVVRALNPGWAVVGVSMLGGQ